MPVYRQWKEMKEHGTLQHSEPRRVGMLLHSHNTFSTAFLHGQVSTYAMHLCDEFCSYQYFLGRLCKDTPATLHKQNCPHATTTNSLPGGGKGGAPSSQKISCIPVCVQNCCGPARLVVNSRYWPLPSAYHCPRHQDTQEHDTEP